MTIATCPGCGRTADRYARKGPYCHPCATVFYKESLRCSRLITRAVLAGEMKRAKDFVCVDCTRPARCYDHRDYTKPFAVDPVCGRCNLKRGHAMWHDAYRERSEATYARLAAFPAPKQRKPAKVAA